jgi:hypothetical protein
LAVGSWSPPHGVMVMAPVVALDSPVPLAVSVVVPGATPVSWAVLEAVPFTGTVTVAGAVAMPGALLVMLIGIAAAAVWLLE